jgi:tRNA threonylcarbamoyladenosine biosynthesis protein TsaE
VTGAQFTSRSPEETLALASAIGRRLRAGDVVLLCGDLGAGKTLFTQGLATGLSVEEVVVSPTFTIVREYEGRIPLVHVDLYRLEDARELYELGFDDVVRGDAVTVIEWGDRLASAFPDCLEVHLEAELDDTRAIALLGRGGSWGARVDALDTAAGTAESQSGS